jgi:hypothetical protein
MPVGLRNPLGAELQTGIEALDALDHEFHAQVQIGELTNGGEALVAGSGLAFPPDEGLTVEERGLALGGSRAHREKEQDAQGQPWTKGKWHLRKK